MSHNHASIPFAHDKLFRSAMSDLRVATDFLQQHLPIELQKKIDWSTLKLSPGTFVDEELQKHETDILYEVQIQTENSPSTTALIYLLAEHQSTPDKYLPLRKLRYIVDILEQYRKQYKKKTLPLIIPVVLYNGKKPYPYSTELFPLFGEFSNEMRESISQFHLIDLHTITDETLRNHRWAGIMELVMKHAHQRDMMAILADFTHFVKMLLSADAHNYFQSIVNYTLNQYEVGNLEELLSAIEQQLPPEQEEKIMTIAEMLEQRGMQQGIRVGEAEFLLRQLRRKFNHIPNILETRVRNASDEQLFIWGEAVLFTNSLEEIFA